MKSIAVVVGTRPEAIKMAPVVHALRKRGGWRCVLVSSGQHQEMLQSALDAFELAPERDLAVMRPGQTLSSLTAALTTALDGLYRELKPNVCLVQGDTTTCLVAGLVAFYHGIALGHVEAGLRSYDLRAPYPEEANRTLVSRLTDLHFAPTPAARDNLVREGIRADSIWVTGNTVVDALLMQIDKQQRTGEAAAIRAQLEPLLGRRYYERPYVLITGHRRESFGQGFREICAAIHDLAERFSDHDFIYPVHLNPQVQAPVRESLGRSANVKLITPLGYAQFVRLLQDCKLVLTDSGGIQEEAPSLGKPVLVMRDVTERPEALAAGTTLLVGPHRDTIVRGVTRLLEDGAAYAAMARAQNPFGDGKASGRIVSIIETFFSRERS
jgi:UDP-N-acetylglucosamine 2-epimerase (non-hydrolysing)